MGRIELSRREETGKGVIHLNVRPEGDRQDRAPEFVSSVGKDSTESHIQKQPQRLGRWLSW